MRRLVVVVLLFCLVLSLSHGCTSSGHHIERNQYAMTIASSKAQKAYDILYEKLQKEYKEQKKDNNLLGHLYATLDLADFHVYGFINYSQALSYYEEAKRLNNQLKDIVNNKNQYFRKGQEEVFFITQGKYTFRRHYSYEKIAHHIEKAKSYIILIIEDIPLRSQDVVVMDPETDPFEIHILKTGNLLNLVKQPDQKILPKFFDQYEGELSRKIRQYLKMQTRISEEEKTFFEKFNLAKTLIKSFDLRFMDSFRLKKIDIHIDDALNQKGCTHYLQPTAYLYFMKAVCQAFMDKATGTVAAFHEMQEYIRKITEVNRKLEEEKKQKKKSVITTGALGLIAIAADVLASGTGLEPVVSDLSTNLFQEAFISSMQNYVVVKRDYALVGESEYSQKLNMLLNIDEQLMLFDAMGKSFHQLKDVSKSIVFNKEAIKIINDLRVTIKSERHRISFAKQKDAIFSRLIHDLAISGQTAEAFYYSENARSRAFVDLIAGAGELKLRDEKSTAYISQVKKQQIYLTQLRRQVNITDAQVDYLNRQLRGIQAVKAAPQPNKENKTSQNAFPDISLKMPETALSLLVSVQPITCDEIKQHLPSETALVEFYIAENKTFAWVIDETQQHLIVLQIVKKDLIEKCIQLREAIRARPYNENRTDEKLKSISRWIYEALVMPLESFIEEKTLIIVPHRITHFIPFDALFDGQRYLAEKHAVTYIPSASVIPFLKQRNTSLESAIILGNPLVTYNSSAKPLPGAEQEAGIVGRHFPQHKILTGLKATETIFFEESFSYDIIHLACHALMNHAEPMSSQLLLSEDTVNDGMLTAKELYSVNLKANIVTLSACETGLSELANGDELIGLVRGFFFAGARSVIASLWKVDDEATKEIMTLFYKELVSGKDKATALQTTKVKLIKSVTLNRPSYWAAFNLYGI